MVIFFGIIFVVGGVGAFIASIVGYENGDIVVGATCLFISIIIWGIFVPILISAGKDYINENKKKDAERYQAFENYTKNIKLKNNEINIVSENKKGEKKMDKYLTAEEAIRFYCNFQGTKTELKVYHEKFGWGGIKSLSKEDYLFVRFDGLFEDKKFEFPSCFDDKFLSLEIEWANKIETLGIKIEKILMLDRKISMSKEEKNIQNQEIFERYRKVGVEKINDIIHFLKTPKALIEYYDCLRDVYCTTLKSKGKWGREILPNNLIEVDFGNFKKTFQYPSCFFKGELLIEKYDLMAISKLLKGINSEKEQVSILAQKSNQTNNKSCIKTGMAIRARTNAEFLNKMFGTNYKQWYKSTYKHNGVWVWMVEFNGLHHCNVSCTYKEEWENRIISANKIFEYYHGTSFIRERKVIGVLEPHLRLAVERKGHGNDRVYIIHGLFAPNYEECEFPRKRIYKKVSDILEIK